MKRLKIVKKRDVKLIMFGIYGKMTPLFRGTQGRCLSLSLLLRGTYLFTENLITHLKNIYLMKMKRKSLKRWSQKKD
jgi:hypothetical protein